MSETMEPIGDIAERIIAAATQDRMWSGKTITQPGIYAGVSIEDYHEKTDLLDGPSVSKSSLMKMAPPSGNPKQFWAYWAHNPKRIEPEPSKAMDFGKAVHALLLGDEVFRDKFVIRPDEAPDGRAWNANNKTSKAWLEEQADADLTVITSEQLEQIKRMADDAAQYELVQLGLLNGRIERSMFWKDPETGIWLKARPDAVPADSGMFADLKTSSSLEAGFLERQFTDLGYYMQAALIRMICRGLGIPFESFTLLYVLSKDYGDTIHRDVSGFALDRGEEVIRYCLRKVRHGLDTGQWDGARTYMREEIPLNLTRWTAENIEFELNRAAKEEREAA